VGNLLIQFTFAARDTDTSGELSTHPSTQGKQVAGRSNWADDP